MLALALLNLQFDDLKLHYEQYRGMSVSYRGVPLVDRSQFQYYEQGWMKGLYSSSWRPQEVRRMRNGDIRASFNSVDGKIHGNVTLRRTDRGFRTEHEFGWRGEKPVYIESAFAMIWAPTVLPGTLSVGGFNLGRVANLPRQSWTLEDRKLGSRSQQFQFNAPLANVSVTVTPNDALLFDARNYGQDWAQGKELLWLGVPDQRIQPNEVVRYETEWVITPRPTRTPAEPVLRKTTTTTPLPAAARPDTIELPLIPQPKSMKETSKIGVPIGDTFEVKADPSLAPLVAEFERALWSRWLKDESMRETKLELVAKVANVNLPPEGYDLRIDDRGATVVGQDLAGLRHGLRTLAMLPRASGGRLTFPRVAIRDWPTITWRGVHKLIGPEALVHQTELIEDVLGPLKFNRVVLQCERTNWRTLPGTEVKITTKREDLAALFGEYREHGFEPIPLIQSFGHMEWFFENGQNLDIAYNRMVPYTVEPRKQRTRDVLEALWSEAIDLLAPETIHFGLDEIAGRGMEKDPELITQLWTRHVPWLMTVASKRKLRPMAWGDMMLAPSEAVDSALGDTPEHSARRRAALPRGTLIADWHYKDDPRPEVYKSLKLWKDAGMVPIAASWFRPNNIRGHTLAAASLGAGTLQTTWAGFASSEQNMVREFRQFEAYVLAAEYAWSGRQEMPNQLGYNPGDVLKRLYFAPPSPTKVLPGVSVLVGPSLRVRSFGNVRASLFNPIELRSLVFEAGDTLPEQVVLPVNAVAREVVLVMDSRGSAGQGQELGRIEVLLEGGRRVTHPILYGRDVLSQSDRADTVGAPREEGLSAVRVLVGNETQPERVVETRVVVTNLSTGLRLHGVTLL